MKQSDIIRFILDGETFIGHLSQTIFLNGKPAIFYKDFDGSNAWTSQDKVEIL